MKLAEKFNRDVVEKLSVSETLLYNEITLKLEEMDKRISSLYIDLCAFNSRLRSIEDELRDIDDLRNVDVERIEALEDCVYDKASIDVGSDIEDENHKVNCGETATISNGNGEDVEWPKFGDIYWYMATDGGVGYRCWNDHDLNTNRESLGNCFRTEEEAKAAVEKLKALKRLRDNGLRFNRWNGYVEGDDHFECCGFVNVYGNIINDNGSDQNKEDLDLLFGGDK